MADKGNAWFSGAGVITGPQPGVQPRSAVQPPSRNAALIRTLLIVAALAAGTWFVLTMVPEELTWEALRISCVGMVLASAFYFPADPKPAFVIWWIMLISECIFFREGDAYSNANAYAGSFPTAAYGEAVAWILCLLALLICSARVRGFFRHLFEGDYKWVTLFAAVCIGSAVYAPRITLALVWGFKLGLVALLILACGYRIRDFRDTVSFLRFTLVAYMIIILQPVIIAAMRGGDMFDEEGRMSTIVSPNALSPNAAIVLLMALILFSKRKGEGLNKSAIAFGLIGLAIMILAGSKTGVLACIFAGTVFFILRGRLGTAFTYVAGTALLVMVLVMTTPLGDYVHLYQDRAGAESFSGRTLLWSAVLPAIKAKPIIGHGYMSTEFLMMQNNAVGWAAPHLHNGFLEALYNTGAIGFIVMVMILVVIPKNLYRVLKRTPKSDYLYRVAAGCLALYAFLVINGFFNSSFGGKCTAPFMLLLGLVIVSQKLLQFAPGSSGERRIGAS